MAMIGFRDFGGVPVSPGMAVCAHRLFRAGSLHAATPGELAALEALGITTVVDLRSNTERMADPIPWPRVVPAPLVADEVVDGIMRRFRDGTITCAELEDWWATTRTLQAPEEHADSVRVVFETLLTAPGGVVVQCRGGKDRTGLIAALVLSTLGADQASVMADFLRTNESEGVPATAPELLPPNLARLGEHAALSWGRVRPEWLLGALGRITARHGSVTGYVAGLGLGRGGVADLRRRYLVPVTDRAG